MNYIFYLKKQVIFYISKALAFIVCGSIMRYVRCGEIIGLIDLTNLMSNQYDFAVFLSYSLSCILLVPFYLVWLTSPKK